MIRDWLHNDRQPSDLYELLDRPRFDPDHGQLLTAVRQAYGELLPYQNHKDHAVAKRAMKFQMELGRAENVLSDPAKLKAHHKEMMTQLRQAYDGAKGGGGDWDGRRVEAWLESEHSVHPKRSEEVAQALLGSKDETIEFSPYDTQAIEPVVDASPAPSVPPSSVQQPGQDAQPGSPSVFRPGELPGAAKPRPVEQKSPPPLPAKARESVQYQAPQEKPVVAEAVGARPAAIRRALAGAFRISVLDVILLVPRPIDKLLQRLAGRDNTILHNFFRAIATIAVLAAFFLAVYSISSLAGRPPVEDATSGVQRHSVDVSPALPEPPPTSKLPPLAEPDGLVRCQLRNTLTNHTAPVNCVAIGYDGVLLASAGQDNTVKIWNAISGRFHRSLRGHTRNVTSVAFSPDGRTLASAGEDNVVKLWDPATGRLKDSLEQKPDLATCLAFHPRERVLALGTAGRTVKSVDLDTNMLQSTLKGHEMPVMSLAFNRQGSKLASGSLDNTIKIWDFARNMEIRTLDRQTGSVLAVDFNRNGNWLASGSSRGLVTVWSSLTGQIIHDLHGHGEAVTSVAFSPSEQLLVSGSKDGTLAFWNLATGGLQQRIDAHSGAVNSVAFSKEGKILATTGGDHTVKLWSIIPARD